MANPIIAGSVIYAQIPHPCNAHACADLTFRVRIDPPDGSARYLTQSQFEELYEDDKGTEWYERQIRCFNYCRYQYTRRGLIG